MCGGHEDYGLEERALFSIFIDFFLSNLWINEMKGKSKVGERKDKEEKIQAAINMA